MKKTNNYRWRMVSLVAIIVILLLAGCTTPTESVDFAETELSVYVGEQFTLPYSITPADASNQEVYVKITDVSYIKEVEKDTYLAIAPGEVEINAYQGETCYSTCKVSITQAIDGIELAQNYIEVQVGDTFSIPYSIYPENYTENLEIAISDENCLKKGQNCFEAVGEGTAQVQFGARGQIYATCEVQILPVPVEKIEFDTELLDLGIGRSFELEAIVTPTNATNPAIVFSCDNDQIVRIDAVNDGVAKLTGVASGTANITATCANGISKTLTVKVSPVEPTHIEIKTNDEPLRIGDTGSLAVIFTPADATDQTVTFKSSNTSIISVDSDEQTFLAKQVGTATITATHKNGVSASIEIEVLPIEVKSITITSKGDASLYPQEGVQLSASVSPENATYPSITWSSDDSTIARVSSSGYVTAVSAGKTTIRATATNGVSKTYSITVNPNVRDMRVTVSASCSGYNHVGNEWSKYFSVNNRQISNSTTISVRLNGTVSVYSKITENDNIPDVGSSSYSAYVKEEFFEEGFIITQTIGVRENRGRYSGNVATWTVTYTFTPVN